MKILFRSWKELNKPRFTTIGLFGLIAFTHYEHWIYSLIVMFSVVVWSIREKNNLTH
jgi:hypothetical protein